MPAAGNHPIAQWEKAPTLTLMFLTEHDHLQFRYQNPEANFAFGTCEIMFMSNNQLMFVSAAAIYLLLNERIVRTCNRPDPWNYFLKLFSPYSQPDF